MDQTQFLELVGALRSQDNQTRKAAEEQYGQLSTAQPAWTMHALAEISATHEDSSTASMCLILLRKLFNLSPSPYDVADAETQQAIRVRMLQILSTAAYGAQRGSASACVSALAVRVFQLKQDWSELWESVFHILGAAESPREMKMVCCEVLDTTSTTLAEFFVSHAQAVVAGLHNCLVTEGEGAAELHKIAFNTVVRLSQIGLATQLGALGPLMLTVVRNRLHTDTDDVSLVVSLVEGVAQAPKLFEEQTLPIITLMMEVASTPTVPSGTRHICIETLLTMCESNAKQVRKIPHFSTSFFELLFQYTLNPTIAPNWDTMGLQDEADELEDDSDDVIGMSGLDRLTIALGGRKLQKVAQDLFAQNIQGADWKQRNAAVNLICYTAEGMSTVFEKLLPSLVAAILPTAKDEIKYVRASGLDCISQLCNDYSPIIQEQMHAEVLPVVIAALRDPVPHVAAAAARCLDAFFDAATAEDEDGDDTPAIGKTCAPYLARICEDCVTLLRSTSHTFVRKEALSALSSVTCACTNLLTPYTDSLVPVYQEILAMPESPDTLDVTCKAIECVTLLAAGVKGAFGPYAQGVCDYLSAFCAHGLRNDDVRTRYILRGWTCMTECMGNAVMPYMTNVMPLLIRMMNTECDVVIKNAEVGDDGEDEDENDEMETVRFVIPGVGEKIARFHTGLIEDKDLAANVVNSIVSELGGALLDFFPEIAESAVKLLTFVVNDSIRESGAFILKEIMGVYIGQNLVSAGQALAAHTLPSLLNALEEESESTVMEVLLDVISRCVSVHPQVVTAANVSLVSEKLLAFLQSITKKRYACLAKKAAEQDEDELDSLEVEDEELQASIESVTDVLGVLLRQAGPVFAPLFIQQFMPVFAEWLVPQADDFSVTRSLQVLCDFAEHSSTFLSQALQATCSSAVAFATSRQDADLLQCDFYLLNLLVRYLANTPEAANAMDVAGFVHQVQAAICQFLAAAQCRNEEYSHTTTNAVSTLVTLLECFGATVLQSDAARMLELLASHLPATGDEIEAGRVHDRVLQWVTGHHAVLNAAPAAAQSFVAAIKKADPATLSDAAKQALSTM